MTIRPTLSEELRARTYHTARCDVCFGLNGTMSYYSSPKSMCGDCRRKMSDEVTRKMAKNEKHTESLTEWAFRITPDETRAFNIFKHGPMP